MGGMRKEGRQERWEDREREKRKMTIGAGKKEDGRKGRGKNGESKQGRMEGRKVDENWCR